MCQFCHTHGEGKKWYLQAENYSRDLLEDMERRRFLLEFFETYGHGSGARFEQDFQKVLQAPAWLRSLIYRFKERRQRRDHFGQVVPLEDVAQVMDLATSIVRVPCICRKANRGRTDAAYCFGLGLDAEKLLEVQAAFLKAFRLGPEDGVFERLTKEEALELHRRFEQEGLIHTIWTFKTPFIGGLCNCDRADCLAMMAYRYNYRAFFRAEYVAAVDQDACSGCRECHSRCQFGAIGFSVLAQKTFIDPLRCYGCGICRSACEMDAIHLEPRKEHPLAANLW